MPGGNRVECSSRPLELLQSRRQFIVRGNFVMPLHAVLHERYAASLAGMGDHAIGLAGRERNSAKSSGQGLDIMPVHFLNCPSESAPAFAERLKSDCSLGLVTLLQAIAINNYREVVQPVLGGGHGGLPVATFLQFAVSGQHESVPHAIAYLGCLGNADTNG